MILDFLQKLYAFVSGLSPSTKNLVIIVMFFTISIMAYEDIGDKIVNDTVKTTVEMKTQAEKYSKEMTPTINSKVREILMGDGEASNVILLSYHNTQTSSQGFSYLYITGITEEARWDITRPYFDTWKELSAINFGNELDRIHKLKFLRVDSVENMKDQYPKLYYKVRDCDAESAAFYPISKKGEPVGMIVILYKEPKLYQLGYYMKVIEPCVRDLADILDYRKELEKMK